MKILKKNTKRTKVVYYGNHPTEPTRLYTGYGGSRHISSYMELESNIFFEMEFVYSSVSRGRSSVTLQLKDIETEQTYDLTPQAIGEFVEMIQNGHIAITDRKTMIGTFTLGKKGESYLIVPVKGDQI